MIKQQYVKTEFNILFHTLPTFFLSLLGTALLLCVLLILSLRLLPESLKIQPFQIGLCVEGTDRMSAYVQEYVKGMESTEDLMVFREMTVKEAEASLQNGELTACIIIPERTAESVMDGTNIPVQVILKDGTDHTGSYLQQRLLAELAECGAALIDVPQAETLFLYELQVENAEELGEVLDLFHFGLVLGRENWFREEKISTFGSIETEEYYLTAGLTLLFLFWGIGMGSFFSGRDRQLSLLLKRRGISCTVQEAVKQGVFFLPYLIPASVIFFRFGKAEMLLPVLVLAVMFSLQCAFFFQIAPTVSVGIVLNSIWGIAGFFSAGGMLPAVFLPKVLYDFGNRLPAGLCMELLRQAAAGKFYGNGKITGVCLLWCLLFGAGSRFALSVRQRRIKG